MPISFTSLRMMMTPRKIVKQMMKLNIWLKSENVFDIKRYLQQNVPAKLDYGTYKRRFHMNVCFEEFEMQLSFEKYQAKNIRFIPERMQLFAIETNMKLSELRPPIIVGMCIDYKFWLFNNYVVHFLSNLILFISFRIYITQVLDWVITTFRRVYVISSWIV